MRRLISAILVLVVGIFALGKQNDHQVEAPKQEAPAKSSESLADARYFGVDEPREWVYEVTFDREWIYYSPYLLIAPIISSTFTHGSKPSGARSITFSIKTSEAYKDQPISITLDGEGKRFWSLQGARVCESKFVIMRSGSRLPMGHPWNGSGRDENRKQKPLQPFPTEMLALEMHTTPCSKDNKPSRELAVGEILGVVPVDRNSRISRYGWSSEPEIEPVTVPSGKYSQAIRSKFPRGDGQQVVEHVVESWIAEGVGLIKYRVTEKKGTPFYTVALKSVRKIE